MTISELREAADAWQVLTDQIGELQERAEAIALVLEQAAYRINEAERKYENIVFQGLNESGQYAKFDLIDDYFTERTGSVSYLLSALANPEKATEKIKRERNEAKKKKVREEIRAAMLLLERLESEE